MVNFRYNVHIIGHADQSRPRAHGGLGESHIMIRSAGLFPPPSFVSDLIHWPDLLRTIPFPSFRINI